MGRACSTYERHVMCIQNFSRKSDGKRPLGRHRRRREYIIRMDIEEIGWESVDWMHILRRETSGGLL
jgi:hypothetical protein